VRESIREIDFGPRETKRKEWGPRTDPPIDRQREW
jgi:hypothetical protein